MTYLVAAYIVIWALVYGYIARISARQNRIMREIETLRKTLDEDESQK
jgi:CcmD family protein